LDSLRPPTIDPSLNTIEILTLKDMQEEVKVVFNVTEVAKQMNIFFDKVSQHDTHLLN